MLLLAISLRSLPVSVAYPVWVGIGALGTALVGILVLDEPWSPVSLFFIGLLGVAVIGLQATTSAH
jgi:quaternary ammonium compound-resistance protein SugE